MLTGVIASFQTGTYTITRKALGSYVDGLYVAGATTTFTIDACVQPVSGRQLDALPDSLRQSEVKKVFTKTSLNVLPYDEISIGGESWVVNAVEKWEAFGDTHYECLVTRQATP